MNATIFIILIAILTVTISLFLQNYNEKHEISPTWKRFFRIMLIAGIVVLIATIIFNLAK